MHSESPFDLAKHHLSIMLELKRALLFVSLVLAGSVADAQNYPRPAGLARLRSKPDATVLVAGLDGRRLELKFVHGSDVRLRNGHLDGIHPEVRTIDAWLDAIGARRTAVFDVPEAELDELRLHGEQRSGRVLHDLNLFFRIELAEEGSAGRVCDALNAFDLVEIAYPLGAVGDPSLPAVAIVDTPNFEPLQGYRRAAPFGIDADYANTFSGGIGTGSLIADVETGWTDDHEDIRHKTEDAFVGLSGAPYPWDHGTAVMGELVGEDQGKGVRGIVADADVRLSSHLGSASNIPTAIVNAIHAVRPGDFLLLEVQCYGGVPDPYPCEFVDSIFASVQAATANGIHVAAAAGNGNRNLDNSVYGGAFDRSVRDSGAILVGASDGSSLDKASFSNYGSRLDAHGWGYEVTSAGYGDLFSDGNPYYLRAYTLVFSGTSSATPIVLGAAVILNSVYREAFGAALDPLVLRSTITATGTPQGSGGNIGPRPNLRAALAALRVPRIAVSGSFTPGSSFDVDLFGPANGLYILCSAPQLRANPLGIPPFGYLLLGAPITRLAVGYLSAGGTAKYTSTIPGNANPGDVFAYFQAWQRYGGPGVGALTNEAEITVQ